MAGTRPETRRRTAALGVVLAVALVVAPAAAPLATAQSGDRVTITVLVTTERETPISGATVTASWDGGETQGTTAGNGRVFLDVPRGATVSFDADHPEYTRNDPLRRTITPDTDEVTVEVSRAVQFTYRVTGADDEAVAGAQVRVLDDRGREVVTGETGSDGRYQTPRLAAADYTVRIERAGYLTVTRSERGTQSVTRPITLERGLATLSVVVTDPRLGEPVAGATVSVAGESVASDADGRVAVDVPVNDQVTVRAEREGYGDARTTVSVAEADRTLELSMSRLPNLTLSTVNERVVVGESTVVTVRDAYDDPAANVTVLLDGEAVGETDADGELTVTVDSAGEHELRARRDNTRSAPVAVEGVATGEAGSATATSGAAGTSTAAVRTPSSGLAPGFGALPALAALAALLALAYASRSPRR
jgi:hypothetical protein